MTESSEAPNGTDESDSLESGIRALRAQPTAAPAMLPGRVMTEVRRQQRQGRVIPMPDGGSATEVDIAAVLRNAADALPEVTARGCRVRPTRDSMGNPVAGPVEVELAVTMSYGSVIPTVSTALEVSLRTAMTKRYGLVIAPLILKVVDLSGIDGEPPAGPDTVEADTAQVNAVRATDSARASERPE